MSNVSKTGADSGGDAAASPSAARRAEFEADRKLVLRAQAGDQSAYEELVRRHQRRLLSLVNGILRGSDDAEDVAQQALVKAYVSLKRFDLRSAFGTWLYKIAVNECLDYFRKKKVRRLVYETDLSEEQIRQMEVSPGQKNGALRNSSDVGRRTEQRDLIERLLDDLDERDRMMLVMKEVEGFTVEEIGETLGLNVNTVKVRLFRARGRLVEIYRLRLKDRKAARPRSAAEERQARHV